MLGVAEITKWIEMQLFVYRDEYTHKISPFSINTCMGKKKVHKHNQGGGEQMLGANPYRSD